MITKIYINYPLKRVPFNGLVVFNGIFYRRRPFKRGYIYLHNEGLLPDLAVPSNILVTYHKES